MSAATERRSFECMSLDEWQANGHEGPNTRDGVIVHARDAEDAAEKWAGAQWQDDPPSEDDTLDVVVLDGGQVSRFTCVARYSFDIIVHRYCGAPCPGAQRSPTTKAGGEP